MSTSRFAIFLILAIVLTEAGVAVWRAVPVPPSTDPVFCYPHAATLFGQSDKLAREIKMYKADRGAECEMRSPDGCRLTVFYFERDAQPVGPKMGFAWHAPEICNEAAGFRLEEVTANRIYERPGMPPLTFDCTRFRSPADADVFVFKMVWIQGLGAQPMRDQEAGNRPKLEGEHRLGRIHKSFTRHVGAVRVLQAGVFGAKNPDHAWELFRTEVLDQLEWHQTAQSVSEKGTASNSR